LKRLLLISRKISLSGTTGKGVCKFCNSILNHYCPVSTTEMCWCPICGVWRLTEFSVGWFFKKRLSFKKKIIFQKNDNLPPRESLANMNRKMDLYMDGYEKRMATKITIYSAKEYSQEFLYSLIPSMKEDYHNEK